MLRRVWGLVPEPLKNTLRYVRNPSVVRKLQNDYEEFRKETDWIVEALTRGASASRGEVLIHSLHGYVTSLKQEFVFGALLTHAGLRPVFVARRNSILERYHRLVPGGRIVYWDDYFKAPGKEDRDLARELCNGVSTVQELIDLEHDGVAVGRNALSWLMRTSYKGHIEIPEDLAQVAVFIADSLAASRASRRVLEQESAEVVLMNERGYSPFGEFFDLALMRGRRVVQFVASHRDDANVFKRYETATRTEHPHALSDQTWQEAIAEPLPADAADRLLAYWKGRYSSGEWFNFQRLQHGKRLYSPADAVKELGIDPQRKTAVIFAHIFWDATFFYGQSLYEDYQTWFVESVLLANKNPALNWLVKLHPVNVWRRELDGTQHSKYSEIAALEAAGIRLAPHVKLIMPETPMNTWTLFELSDYCVTVRGTVGVEMAALGKPVIVAGTGPYSPRGFTINPLSVKDYENTLAGIQDIAPLSEEKRDLALRYARALLERKPFDFQTFGMKYSRARDADHVFNGRPFFSTHDAETLLGNDRAKAWVNWLVSGTNADCILQHS